MPTLLLNSYFTWINLFLLNHILLYSLLFPFQSIQTYVVRVPVLNGLFRLHILILSCVLYKTQSSSLKDSPRTQTNFLRLWHGKEKTLAVCLEILQDYTAKVFSFSCHADNG